MKLPLFLCVLCASALTIAAPELPSGAVGRYQIISSRVYSLGLQSGQPVGHEIAVTLRLDTTTGQTWQLWSLNVDGTTLDMWQPVSEPDKRKIGEIMRERSKRPQQNP